VLTLPDQLTHVQATACLAGLAKAAASEAAPVQVDATAVRRFDSSALAVLLDLRRVCDRLGKPMVVRGLPEGLHDLATLYGIEGLLPSA
jgi:phospholipid transport system transporter-binding protein